MEFAEYVGAHARDYRERSCLRVVRWRLAVQFSPNGGLLNVEDRKARTGHAIVYALDAATGDVLFSSASTIRGFSHFSAPAVGGGRVYVGTEDGMLYAFGLGIPQP